jgi:hypothetical protein
METLQMQDKATNTQYGQTGDDMSEKLWWQKPLRVIQTNLQVRDTPRMDPRDFPFVRKALASIDKGGYAEAVARVAFLLAHKDEPLPLSRLQLAHELIKEYRELLPEVQPDEARRIEGEQEIIARYEPDQAIEKLPALLTARKDRARLLTLLERVLADKRVQRIQPSAEQEATLVRIRGVLGTVARRARMPAAR